MQKEIFEFKFMQRVYPIYIINQNMIYHILLSYLILDFITNIYGGVR